MSKIQRTIRFKAECAAEAQDCLDMLDRVAIKRSPKEGPHVLNTWTDSQHRRCITVRFRDELDYLSFLVALGAAEIRDEKPKETSDE
jgi:hypothetical protein